MVFLNDLEFGEKYQRKLIDYIEYDTVEYAPNKQFSDYDVKILRKNRETLFEVKADKLTSKTGNICIEFECNKKPSGIETTKSNYYAYFVINENDDDLYLIPTKKIKRMIQKQLYNRCINGGDGYRSRMYLFKKELFNKYLF